MKAFQDKVVWITGASSGVGEGLAQAFAESGAKLILSARRVVELERVRRSLSNTESLVLPLDVTHFDAIPTAVRTATDRFGQIDLVICNAGVAQLSRITDTSLDTYRQLLEVDLLAVIAHIQAVLPTMQERGSGHIVVTSSVAGKFGIPNMAGYCAAKHAIQGFCDSLRAEVAENSIDVTTLILAGVNSRVFENALTGDGTPSGNSAAEGSMDSLEAGRKIVRQLARRKPEINVVADWRAHAALILQRLMPRRVYKRMARVAQSSDWQ